ncbi:MAG TPA: hypothetical protein VHF06_29635 [Pseudonocardiaceae bacterium]|jgi:hypothetical protein|nr:hypothetical protein [Pseudonocardiaceae bacterium]
MDMVGRLFFGRDDAEHDMTDGLLRAGFLPTTAFEEALSGRKSLIIGRKGSGKTAICRRLAMDDVHPGATCLVAPDDAAGEEIRRFELVGLTAANAKALIWRYVFAVQAARHLVAHAKPAHGRRPASVKALHKFLVKNGEQTDEQFYDRVARGVRGLQTSLSLEAFGIKVAVDKKGTPEGVRASKQLEVVEAGVAGAFAELGCTGHAPLLLLVDQLEQVWSDDPDSEAMVVGLLLATKHVVDAYGKAVRCVAFLRADIYDALDFAEADKFHSDEIRIDWSDAKLADLALTRASVSLGRPVTWDEVFPARVEGTPTRQYLLSRVLPRPRDVIQYLNSCRDVASEHGRDSITEADVILATLRFSQWKLQDLGKEYRVRFPFLDRLFALFQNTGYVVLRDAVADRLRPVLPALHDQYRPYQSVLDPSGVVDILYSVGFLGVRRGADVVYASGTHVPAQPTEHEFHIHPCFRPALNAMNAVELKPYLGEVTHAARGVAQSNYVAAAEYRFVGTASQRMSEALLRACDQIRRQVVRSDLPAETKHQVVDEVSQVMADALRQGEGMTVEHVIKAANYLEQLAVSVGKHIAAGESLDVVRGIQRAALRVTTSAYTQRFDF